VNSKPGTSVRLFAYLLVLLLLPPFSTVNSVVVPTYRYTSCRIPLLAVSGNNTGVVIPGEIRVYHGGRGLVSVSSASEDLLVSIKIALIYASITTGVDYKCCDYYLKVEGDVKGLSATLLFYIVFSHILSRGECPENISATGIIGPGGVIGAVGGLEYKLRAAQTVNLALVYIPGVQREYANYTSIPTISVYTVYDYVSRPPQEDKNTHPLLERMQSLFKPVYENLSNTAGKVLRELEDLNWSDRYFNSARERLEYSHVAASQGKYYVAASLAFSALIDAYTSRLLYFYVKKPGELVDVINTLLSNVLSVASSIKREITWRLEEAVKTGLMDPVYLDLLITAYTRASEAERIALEATHLNSDLSQAISVTTVAQARVLSAIGWLNVSTSAYNITGRFLSIDNVSVLSEKAREFLNTHVEYLSQLGIVRKPTLPREMNSTVLLEVLDFLLSTSRDLYTPDNTVFIPREKSAVENLVRTFKDLFEHYIDVYEYTPISALLVADLAEYYLNYLDVEPSSVISLVYPELSRVALYMYMTVIKSFEATSPLYFSLQREVLVACLLIALTGILISLYYVKRKLSRRSRSPGTVI